MGSCLSTSGIVYINMTQTVASLFYSFLGVIHFIIALAVHFAVAASGDGRSNPLSSRALLKVPEM